MANRMKCITLVMVVLVAVVGAIGCQNSSGGEGIHVMFKGSPKIFHPDVYHHGHVVGSVLEQSGVDGGASKVTIRIASDYRAHAGQHWAFYVDNGRLTAGRLTSSGHPVQPGDRMCGFHSKAAFNWFKVKTLLTDRVSKAGRRAAKLYRRYSQSG